MTFDEIDILIGVDRRLKHILGAHSDSVQWYENQVRQTLRWIEETRRRYARSLPADADACRFVAGELVHITKDGTQIFRAVAPPFEFGNPAID